MLDSRSLNDKTDLTEEGHLEAAALTPSTSDAPHTCGTHSRPSVPESGVSAQPVYQPRLPFRKPENDLTDCPLIASPAPVDLAVLPPPADGLGAGAALDAGAGAALLLWLAEGTTTGALDAEDTTTGTLDEEADPTGALDAEGDPTRLVELAGRTA